MLIHGRYHFRPTYTAFKNDHCRSCSAERTCVEVQTFDVVHIYWIPLVPFGTQKRWFCSTCGQDPHVRTKTRRWVKILGCVFFAITAVFLGILVVTLWLDNDPKDNEALIDLSVGAVAALAIGLTLGISAAKQEPDTPIRLNENYENDRSSSLLDCPLCGTILVDSPQRHCPKCLVPRL